MKNTVSIFPEAVDSRIYWSDINISQNEIMKQYQAYIKNGQYDDSLRLLMNSDIFYYGAWIINLFRNRLINIDEYVEENISIPFFEPLDSISDDYEPLETPESEVLLNYEPCESKLDTRSIPGEYSDTEPVRLSAQNIYIENETGELTNTMVWIE